MSPALYGFSSESNRWRCGSHISLYKPSLEEHWSNTGRTLEEHWRNSKVRMTQFLPLSLNKLVTKVSKAMTVFHGFRLPFQCKTFFDWSFEEPMFFLQPNESIRLRNLIAATTLEACTDSLQIYPVWLL